MLVGSLCLACGSPGQPVCDGCAAQLAPAPPLALPHGLDACLVLFDYDSARRLVTALKNGGRRDLVGWLAAQLATRPPPASEAVVTWAPTGRRRQLARGYDQAELLARALARRWHLPVRALLRRESGPAQAGRSARERRTNPSFAAVGTTPAAVVVVDDVVTTGATMTAAARTLRQAGASSVAAVAVARARHRRAA